jgi:hypothetical protein
VGHPGPFSHASLCLWVLGGPIKSSGVKFFGCKLGHVSLSSQQVGGAHSGARGVLLCFGCGSPNPSNVHF